MLQQTSIKPARTSPIQEGSTVERSLESWGGPARLIQGGRSSRPDVVDKPGTTSGGGIKVRPSGHNESTDAELVKAFQSGSDREAALIEIFERYGQLTYAFLRRRLGNREVAAELNQELYIGVMESLDRFRGDSSLKTWIFRLAHHRLSNQRRRWRTHLDELPDAAPEELVNVLSGDESEQPDLQFDKSEQVHALERCMAGLPEVQRAVIVGQYYEDVTLEELTRNLNLTNKSGARASLIAAQRKLRRCLENAGITAE